MLRILTVVIFAGLSCLSVRAQLVPKSPLMVGLGEGAQSLDAAYQTQVHGYLPLAATRIGVSFPLPLIKTGFSGMLPT